MPADRFAITPDSSPKVIEQWADNLHKDALSASKDRRLQSEINWSFYLGKQDKAIRDGELTTFWNHGARPYRTENLLRPMVDTQAMRTIQDMPDATTKPVTPDAVDRNASTIAAGLVEYWTFESSLVREDAKVALWGWLSGAAGYKVTYNPDVDAIRMEPVRLWEFLLDPDASSTNDARWVTFISHVDKYTAHAMAENRGSDLKLQDIQETSYQPGVCAAKRDGVEVRELWHLPTAQVSEGLYALFIGDALVEVKAYPYMLPSRDSREKLEGYLPLVLFSPGETDDGPLGSSPVDDAVHIQRLHNENLSWVAHLTALSADLKLYGNKAVLDQLRPGANQFIEADPSQRPAWGEAPRISPALWTAKEESPAKMASVLGIDGQIAGQRGWTSGQSARSIAYIEQVDSTKLLGAKRAFQEMKEAKFELGLKLAQTFLSDNQLYNMPDGDNVKTLSFRGADLHGVTVRLEPRQGLEKYSDQKAQNLAERAKAGLADPQDAARALEDGPPKSAFEELNKKLALLDLEDVVNGLEPRLEADPSIAVAVLKEAYAALVDHDEDAAQLCKQLAAAYAQQLQGQPQPAPQQQQPTPGAPMPPQSTP